MFFIFASFSLVMPYKLLCESILTRLFMIVTKVDNIFVPTIREMAKRFNPAELDLQEKQRAEAERKAAAAKQKNTYR